MKTNLKDEHLEAEEEKKFGESKQEAAHVHCRAQKVRMGGFTVKLVAACPLHSGHFVEWLSHLLTLVVHYAPCAVP